MSAAGRPILRMVASRLGIGLFTLLVISVLIFLAISLLPGDIAQQVLGQSATPRRSRHSGANWAWISRWSCVTCTGSAAC